MRIRLPGFVRWRILRFKLIHSCIRCSKFTFRPMCRLCLKVHQRGIRPER